MAVEEAFGVKIADHEAAQLDTVGQLFDIVAKDHNAERGAPCLSARAFRRMRKCLPNGARPSSKLSEICGSADPREFLDRIGCASGVNLAMDTWDSPLSQNSLSVLIGAAVGISILVTGEFYPTAILCFVVALSVGNIPRREDLDPAQMTLADVINRTLVHNYDFLRDDKPTGTRSDIWHTLCGICRFHAVYDGPIDRQTTFFRNVQLPEQQGKD